MDWITDDSIMRQVIGVIKRLVRVHSLALLHYGRCASFVGLYCDCCGWAIQHAAGGADCYSLQREVLCALTGSTLLIPCVPFRSGLSPFVCVHLSRPAGFFSLLIKIFPPTTEFVSCTQHPLTLGCRGYSNRK